MKLKKFSAIEKIIVSVYEEWFNVYPSENDERRKTGRNNSFVYLYAPFLHEILSSEDTVLRLHGLRLF